MTEWINSSIEHEHLSEPWVMVGYVGGALTGVAVAAVVVLLVALVTGIPV